LDASYGKIAFDGSISSHKGEIIIENTIDCTVKDGYIVDIQGGNDAELLKESIAVGEKMARQFAQEGKIPSDMLDHYVKNAKNIGELGIGLNPEARIIGNMLEDEKVLSTCHFAVGANYDEDAKAMIHLDGLVQNPTIVAITADGKETTIMEDGKLVE
ncbi:MAG TPA: peptidase M17, partial [Euryarchaeota archaeon]|nr:peptidase M17 [Euryarchaeota archaeon]